MADENSLDRFVEAQTLAYQTALAEIRRGAKRSHWMWFVFPQIAGLGRSSTSRHFAIRSLDAWTGQAPLVGQPTTGREVSGKDSFHPGPFENWWAGPWLHILGPSAGLALAVAAVDGAALASSVWLGYRRGGPMLAVLVAGGLGLLAHSLGAGSLWDPYNSEVPTYPLIAAALALIFYGAPLLDALRARRRGPAVG